MSSIKMDQHMSYVSRRRAESREYWLIFCVLYPPLLVAAMLNRIVALTGGGTGLPAGARRSIFVESKIAAASCIPFIFK